MHQTGPNPQQILIKSSSPSNLRPRAAFNHWMSLKPRNIKFDDRIWEMACEEASCLGMTTAEFIRGAVAARCWIARTRRQPEISESLGELYEAVDRYLQAMDGPSEGAA